MSSTSQLLFELSHRGRVELINTLIKGPERLSTLSEKLQMTSAEVSRHLKRLTNVNILSKNKDGEYYVTPYGRTVLYIMEKMEKLVENWRFFDMHDFSVLPEEMFCISNILNANIITNVMHVISELTDVLKAAERFIDVITTFDLLSTLYPYVGKTECRALCRIISPDTPHHLRRFFKGKKGCEIRQWEDVRFSLFINEKRWILMVPDFSGRIDYTAALTEGDEGSIVRMRSLFQYCWDKAGK